MIVFHLCNEIHAFITCDPYIFADKYSRNIFELIRPFCSGQFVPGWRQLEDRRGSNGM
jgi:hypothetical protein